MANQETESKKYVQIPTFIMPDGICLNNQTTGNLIKYLQVFPNDAKVIIHHTDREGNYMSFDCQIGCNMDYQAEKNRVILILGMPVED